MVWIYENPLKSTKHVKLKKYVEMKTGNSKLAEKLTKMLSLDEYLFSHKFVSPKEITESAFLDKEKTKPIFSLKTAKNIFNQMHIKKGGRSGVVLGLIINYVGSKGKEMLPENVQNILETIAESPYSRPVDLLESIEGYGPLISLLKEVLLESGKTAAFTIEQAGVGIGGPVGAAAVAIPVAIISFITSLVHMGNGDIGETIATFLLAIPEIGPILYKVSDTVDKLAIKTSNLKDKLSTVPMVGDYAVYIPSIPKEGGKRFTLKQNKYNKWQKSRKLKMI